jgi:hypothetical protein
LLLAVVLVGLAAALGFTAGAGTAAPEGESRLEAARKAKATVRAHRSLARRIVAKRDETWKWQFVMGKRRFPYAATAERSLSTSYRRWALRLWTKRAARAARQARRPPHYEEWLCIHRYEGSWTDPNAPYYGGLQMDLSFQRTYGPHLLRAKGTADRWTPLEQMWVAERAHSSGRGFYPWPSTARVCGLL